ncbi:MAG: hypothetical protein JNM72_05720 [Deltaproteobacteria bacterium]|nr:hypothetical protein [Deltaproteobacteria bacterium]
MLRSMLRSAAPSRRALSAGLLTLGLSAAAPAAAWDDTIIEGVLDPAAAKAPVDCEEVAPGTVISTDPLSGRAEFCAGPPLPPTPEALRAQWRAMPPIAVMDEVTDRIAHGDFAGAIDRLDVLRGEQLHPELAARVRFERGRAAELSHRCAEAVPLYEEVLAMPAAASGLRANAQFRRSLCLSDMGEHRAAKRGLRAADREPGVDALGHQKIAVEGGVQALRRGRERRGLPALQAALAALPEGEAPWVRSRALFALVERELAAAAQIQFRGDERAAAALVKRAEHIGAAEQHVIAIVKLREPEYVLAALLAMGDAYDALQVDLVAAPPPRHLTPDQVVLYREALVERGEVLRRKALKYWELGLQEGLSVQWVGPELDGLRARLSAAG